MAKSKSKSMKLPKQIAGMTVPKQLRKTGNQILDAATRHPVVTELAAAALLAAASALRDGKRAKAATRAAGEQFDDLADKATRDAGQFKQAIKSAAREALDNLSAALNEARTAPAKPPKNKKAG